MRIKDKLRSFFWTLLGKKYRSILDPHLGLVYLKDFKRAEIGLFTIDNGAKVWSWNPNSKLKVGKFSGLAYGVDLILDPGNHQFHTMTTSAVFHLLYDLDEKFRYKGKEYVIAELESDVHNVKHSIEIGNDVWIATGCKILPGVKIGNGAIISAGSVVTKDVERYSVVGGAPAKFIRYRFDPIYHDDLDNIAWWNWKPEVIKSRITDLELDVEEFVLKFK